jgi:hypothetical protein
LPLFVVNYDLIKNKDYQSLWDRLARYRARRVLLSSWVIKANCTAIDLRDDLSRFIDPDDRLFVDESNMWAGQRLMFDPNDW